MNQTTSFKPLISACVLVLTGALAFTFMLGPGTMTVPVLAEKMTPLTVKVESAEWTGSGVFVADDVVLTARHVAESAQDLRVVDTRGVKYDVVGVILCPDGNDMALLFVKTKTVEPRMTLADTIVGEAVVHIGSPLGMQDTVTTGIVSRKHADTENLGSGLTQIDAVAAPGSSGGAVFDMRGRLIGILIGGCPGYDFCIPASAIQKFLNQVRKEQCLSL